MVSMQELAFGCEVECVGATRERIAWAVQSVVGGTVRHVGHPTCYDPFTVEATDGRVWSVVADGSLTEVEPALRAEVVTPILGWNDLPVLQAVIRAVRAAGGRQSPSAGLHVHCSSSLLTPQALTRLAKLVWRYEDLIYAAFGVTAARMARYCKPLDPAFLDRLRRRRPTTMEAFNACVFGTYQPQPQRYCPERYHVVNFASACLPRRTVEFRAYPSTVMHAGKIKAAVILSLALTARAITARAVGSTKRNVDPTSARFDFRVFLVSGLGLVGPEFHTARTHLIANLPGDAAWKCGSRPDRTLTAGKTASKVVAPLNEGRN